MARADYSRRDLAGNILSGVAAGVAATDAANVAQLNALPGTATPIAADVTAAAVGTASKFAREDHRHAVTVAAPVALGSANAAGSQTSLARSDHIHIFPTAANVGAAATSHSHAIGDLPVAPSGTSNTTQVVRADDSRLSNARTPTTHTHVATTDLTATGTKDTTTFLRGDNTWAAPPAGGGGITQAEADTRYVNVTGDTMTGELVVDAARHVGVRFIEAGSAPIEQRMIGMRTTTSGVVGIGVFKPPDDPTQPLLLQPLGVGNPTQVEHAITKGYLETQNTSGTVTPTTGWSANSVTWITRNGWAVVTFDALRKSTAPATGNIMFTLPTGVRPVTSTWWLSLVSNTAATGGGLKSYLGSVDTTGQMQIRGAVMPAANEQLYGTITYPCV